MKRNGMPTDLRDNEKQIETVMVELRKQLEAMQELNLIRPSQARTWSQVLMTPKPGGKLRFCVDYRQLNDLTTSVR